MRSEDSAVQAIEQLYHDYHQPILRYLERLVTTRETAEDLVHETFVKVLRHWDQHEPAAPARSWPYRIATNSIYDSLRCGRKIAIVPITPNDTAPFATQERQIDEAASVWRALQRMPAAYRVPLMLHIWPGYPLKDIATALGINVAPIKTRVHRARMKFPPSTHEVSAAVCRVK
jgi:RNA polymerase sigma-70 factor, ECF subfamily